MSQSVFHANRADGLGARLRVILNAIALANRFNADFSFMWPRNLTVLDANDTKHHSVDKVEEVFSSSFIVRHYKEIERTKIQKDYIRNYGSIGEIEKILADGGDHAFLVTAMNLYGSIAGSAEAISHSDIRAAFDQIGFSPRLQAAKKHAAEVPLDGEYAALHLRAGDIVFGYPRMAGGFHRKVIPFHLAESAIQKMQAEGRKVMIFGQDQDLCGHMANKYGVVLANSLAGNHMFDSAQAALFEICLMARCGAVLHGNSAFSHIACLVGGAASLTPRDLFTASEIVDLTRDMVNRNDPAVSDTQKAFAVLNTLLLSGPDLNMADRAQFIDYGRRTAPENPLLILLQALCLYEQGAPNEAENLLLRELQEEAGQNLIWLLSEMRQYNIVRDFMPDLRQQAKSGLPVAAVCCAYRALCADDAKEAKACAKIYFENRGDRRTAVDGDLETALKAHT